MQLDQVSELILRTCLVHEQIIQTTSLKILDQLIYWKDVLKKNSSHINSPIRARVNAKVVSAWYLTVLSVPDTSYHMVLENVWITYIIFFYFLGFILKPRSYLSCQDIAHKFSFCILLKKVTQQSIYAGVSSPVPEGHLPAEFCSNPN